MQKGLINRFILIRWPAVEPKHQMCFIGLIPNFNPHTLYLLLTVSQWELLTVYPHFSIKGNSPSSPISPSLLKAYSPQWCCASYVNHPTIFQWLYTAEFVPFILEHLQACRHQAKFRTSIHAGKNDSLSALILLAEASGVAKLLDQPKAVQRC